jgi:hypothetical protein
MLSSTRPVGVLDFWWSEQADPDLYLILLPNNGTLDSFIRVSEEKRLE